MTDHRPHRFVRVLSILLLSCVLPQPAAAQDKTMADYERLVTPALRKVIDEQIVLLNRWPDRQAQRAARELIGLGDPVVPDLARELKSGHFRSQIASAFIAGELKAKILFEPVITSARNPSVRAYLTVYFTALSRIDASESVPAIARFLGSSFAEERRTAERFLAGLVDEAHLPFLLKNVETRRGATRAAFVRLVGSVGGDGARKALISALDDRDASVAAASARALARLDDEKTIDALVKIMGDEVRERRVRSFATLGLVHIGEDRGGHVFPPASFPLLLRGARHTDAFSSYASAIALAQIGRLSRDKQVSEALDTLVPPLLIKAALDPGRVSVQDWTKSDMKTMALVQLRRITGEDHGSDLIAWGKWWIANRKRFQAVRSLSSVEDEMLGQLRIRFVRADGDQRDDWRFGPDFDEDPKLAQQPVRQFVLTAAELAQLFRELERRGLLTARSVGSVRSSRLIRGIELTLGRQERRLIAAGSRPAWMAALEEVLDDWADRLAWQLYRDFKRYPERAKWYAEMREFWDDRKKSELERSRQMKTQIIGSLARLGRFEWPEAARRLDALLRAEPGLRPTQAKWLLLMTHAYSNALLKNGESGWDKTVDLLSHCVARSLQPDAVAGDLLQFLTAFDPSQTQSVLETLMAHVGYKLARQFLDKHPDKRLRAAAAAAMWRYHPRKPKDADAKLDERLIALLADESSLVREASARALGRRRVKLALPNLLELMEKDTSSGVRRAALVAVGQAGGAAQVALLAKELVRDKGDAVGAAQALAATEDASAVAPLLSRYLAADDVSLRAALLEPLLTLPRKAVSKAGLAAALDANRTAAVRVRALSLLGRLPVRTSAAALLPLLKSKDPGVRREAALVTGMYHRDAAVPVLIAELAARPDDARVRTALEAATVHSLSAPSAQLAGAWRTWWEKQTAAGTNWRARLVAAMKVDLGDAADDGLRGWVASGEKPAPKGAASLIRALDGRWYVVRAASHALAEIYDIDRPAPSRFASLAVRRANQRIWRDLSQRK